MKRNVFIFALPMEVIPTVKVHCAMKTKRLPAAGHCATTRERRGRSILDLDICGCWPEPSQTGESEVSWTRLWIYSQAQFRSSPDGSPNHAANLTPSPFIKCLVRHQHLSQMIPVSHGDRWTIWNLRTECHAYLQAVRSNQLPFVPPEAKGDQRP